MPLISGFFQLRNARGQFAFPNEGLIFNRDTYDYNFNGALNPVLHIGRNTHCLQHGNAVHGAPRPGVAGADEPEPVPAVRLPLDQLVRKLAVGARQRFSRVRTFFGPESQLQRGRSTHPIHGRSALGTHAVDHRIFGPRSDVQSASPRVLLDGNFRGSATPVRKEPEGGGPGRLHPLLARTRTRVPGLRRHSGRLAKCNTNSTTGGVPMPTFRSRVVKDFIPMTTCRTVFSSLIQNQFAAQWKMWAARFRWSIHCDSLSELKLRTITILLATVRPSSVHWCV